jgi:hypothetical protein
MSTLTVAALYAASFRACGLFLSRDREGADGELT